MNRSSPADHGGDIMSVVSFSDYHSRCGATNDELRFRLREATIQEVETGLTQRQYELVTLYYYRGYTIPQLAARFGINKSTVSRGLAGARKRLEKRILRRLAQEAIDM